jgi:hypothetical protein
MGISLNPITIIAKAFIRIIEIIFKNIKSCRSSCCESNCTTKGNSRNSTPDITNNNYVGNRNRQSAMV